MPLLTMPLYCLLCDFCDSFIPIHEFCSLVQLGKGYPLPALGKMELVNTQLQILKVRDWLFLFFFLKIYRYIKLHVDEQAA